MNIWGWMAVLTGGFLLVKGTQAASVKDFYNKIKYGFTNIKIKLSNWNVYFSTDVDITNQTQFSIPIKNINVTVQVKNDGAYKDFCYTKKSIPEVQIKANQTVKINALTLDVGFGATAIELWNGLVGKTTDLKIIITYLVQGYEQTVEELVPINVSKSLAGIGGDENATFILTPISGYNGIGNININNLR